MTPPDHRSMGGRGRDGQGRNQDDGKPFTDDEVDYLLSDGRLGSSQRDRILDAIAGALPEETSRRPRRARRWAVGAALAAAAMVALVVGSSRVFDRGHFQSKGQGQQQDQQNQDDGRLSPSAGVQCLGSTLTACPRGALLAFSVSVASANVFVTASLEPVAGGPRTWLLSNEPAAAQASGSPGLLARGARVPADQPPGAYRVHVIVAGRPLSHEEAVAVRPEQLVAHSRFDLTVTP